MDQFELTETMPLLKYSEFLGKAAEGTLTVVTLSLGG
jgi:hypothetical protein